MTAIFCFLQQGPVQLSCFLSILKKVTAATPATVATGPPINERTNSLRNAKLGIKIAFLIKMCKKPSLF